jgi:hypothetical protein
MRPYTTRTGVAGSVVAQAGVSPRSSVHAILAAQELACRSGPGGVSTVNLLMQP